LKKTFALILIAAVLLTAFGTRFYVLEKQTRALDKAASQIPMPSYKVMQMKAAVKPVPLVLPSFLEAINVTPIWARTNGYLINFLVDIGDRVREGQLLAEIDTPDVDAELARAEGELASRIAKQNIAQVTADRWNALYAFNAESISKEEVDVKTADELAAIADVQAAIANVEYWKTMQQFKNIYAPFDGIITKRNVIDIGTLITAGSDNNPIQLFEIAKTDVLRAFVDVPQAYFFYIQDGLPAAASVWQYPGKAFPGIIDRNTGALDPQSRTLLTQVNIDNRYGELMPGLYAEVAFSFPQKTKTFYIPVGALIIRSGPTFVAVVKDNKVHLTQVKVGIDDGRTIQIIEGISENDLLIVNPTDRTVEGLAVKPVPLTHDEETMLMGL